MSQTPYADFIALAGKAGGIRHVRTPEGALYFHLPIGSPITEALYQAIKAEHKAKGHYWPKGMTTRDPNKVHTGGTGNAAAAALEAAQDAEEQAQHSAAKAAAPHLPGAPAAAHAAPTPSAPTPSAPHSAPSLPAPKLAPSENIKSSISGPNKFSVGTVEFSAPVGSRLYEPTDNTGVKFVLTPDGEIHAFNSKGELKLDNALVKAALKAKFTPDFQGDEHYTVGSFDPLPTPEDLPNVPEGSTLNDTDGTAQFTKTGSDQWTHNSLGIHLSTADVQPFVASGELSVAAGTDSKNANVHLDFSKMDQPTFQETLKKFPTGKQLYFKGQTLTKTKNGTWSGEKNNTATSSDLWYLKHNLSDDKEASQKPSPEPVLPELPGEEAAAEAPAAEEISTDSGIPSDATPGEVSAPATPAAPATDAATPPTPLETPKGSATAEAPEPKKSSAPQEGDVLTKDNFYNLPGGSKISVQSDTGTGTYTYVPKTLFNKNAAGWKNDTTHHVYDPSVFHKSLTEAKITLDKLGGKDEPAADKSAPKTPSVPFPEPKVVHKDSEKKMVPTSQDKPEAKTSFEHDEVLSAEQLKNVPVGKGVTVKFTPSSGSGLQVAPAEYRKTGEDTWQMVKKTPQSTPTEISTQKLSTYTNTKGYKLHYNDHPSEDAKAPEATSSEFSKMSLDEFTKALVDYPVGTKLVSPEDTFTKVKTDQGNITWGSTHNGAGYSDPVLYKLRDNFSVEPPKSEISKDEPQDSAKKFSDLKIGEKVSPEHIAQMKPGESVTTPTGQMIHTKGEGDTWKKSFKSSPGALTHSLMTTKALTDSAGFGQLVKHMVQPQPSTYTDVAFGNEVSGKHIPQMLPQDRVFDNVKEATWTKMPDGSFAIEHKDGSVSLGQQGPLALQASKKDSSFTKMTTAPKSKIDTLEKQLGRDESVASEKVNKPEAATLESSANVEGGTSHGSEGSASSGSEGQGSVSEGVGAHSEGPVGSGDSGSNGGGVVLKDGTKLKTLGKIAPTTRVKQLAKEGLKTPDIYELHSSEAQAFHDAISAMKENNPHHASVYVYPVEDYAKMRLFMTPDGKGGIALKGNEIVSVFVHSDSEHKGSARALLATAVGEGGQRLDAFDTVLPKLYAKEGFVPVARTKWDDEFAPEGWDKATYAKYNNGSPDVVFMVHVPGKEGSDYVPGSGVMVKDYETAEAMTAAAVQDMKSGGNPVSALPVGANVSSVDQLIGMHPGTVLDFQGKSGVTKYTKLPNGNILNPNGQQFHPSTFEKAIKDGKFSVHSYPTLSNGPATDNAIQLVPGGKHYSEADLKDALDALEKHPSFQISYGLKSLDKENLLHESHEGNQAELKLGSASEFPHLKSKPAAIAYLKKKLGIEDAAPATAAAENINEPKVTISAGDAKHEFTASEIENAISILNNYQGKLWANELSKKGNPLGQLKWNDAVGFHKDKNEGKKAALSLLDQKLKNLNAQKPKVEEPKVEEPKVEEPKVEEPKVEEKFLEDLKPGDTLNWEQFQKQPVGTTALWTPEHSSEGEPYTLTKGPDGSWHADGMHILDSQWKNAVDSGRISLHTKAPTADETPEGPNVGDTLTVDQFKALEPNSTVLFHLVYSPDAVFTKQADGTWLIAGGNSKGTKHDSYFEEALLKGKGELVSKPGDLPDYAEAPAAVQSKPDVAAEHNESGILPGKYTDPSAPTTHLIVNADGTGTYTNQAGTSETLNPNVVKNLHTSGFNHYEGVVDAPQAEKSVVTPVTTTPKKPATKKNSTKKTALTTPNLPDGTYFLGSPGIASSATYEVKNGQVTITKANGDVSTGPLSKLKTNFNSGKILDANGNSVIPDGYSGPITMWNSPMTTPALLEAQKILEDDQHGFFSNATQAALAKVGFKLPFNATLAKVKKANLDLPISAYTLQYYSTPETPGNPEAAQLVLDQIGQFLQHVDTKVPESNASGLFDWSTDGEAIMPAEVLTAVQKALDNPYSAPAQTEAYNAVKKAFGNGKIIGQASLDKWDKKSWLNDFVNGDFAGMYATEVSALANKNKAHPAGYLHPGYAGNEATNHITWGAAVPGEVTAAKADSIPGDWSSVPVQSWSLPEIQNYLIAAHMQHPEHLSGSEQREWVLNHKAGKKLKVDALSVLAKQRAEANSAALSEPLAWTDDIKPAKTYDYLFDSTPFPTSAQWNSQAGYTASHDWAADNWDNQEFQDALKSDLEGSGYGSQVYSPTKSVDDYTGYQLEHGVGKYFDQKLAEHEAELLKPVYSHVKVIAAGTHDVHLYQDQFGKKYIFKPMPQDFRIEAEIAGNKLGKYWGYGSAHSEMKNLEVPNEGEKQGLLQEFIPNVSDFSGSNGKPLDLTTLSDKQLGQMAAEHVLDWMLDNDDTHSENLLLTQDGKVVGIDKGRAFRAYGQWNGLSGDSKAHTNASIIFTKLYDGIRNGSISPEQANAAYLGALKAAQRIQKSSDSVVSDIVKEGMAHRTKWAPESYMNHFDHSKAPSNEAQLIEAVLHRKADVPNQIKEMWAKIYKDAGLGELPEPPQHVLGEEHISGWQEPSLMDKVAETHAWGSAPIHAHAGIQEGHSLLWTEESKDGQTKHVGMLKLGSLTQKKVLSFLQSKVSGDEGLTQQQVQNFPSTQGWKSALSAAGKDLTKNVIEKNFDPEIQKKFEETKSAISEDNAHWSPTLTPGEDGMITFPSGNKVPESGLYQYKLALQHYTDLAQKVDSAKENGTVTNKTDFSVFSPIAYAPNAQTFVHPDSGKYSQLSNGSFVHAPTTGELSVVHSVPAEVAAEQNGWSKLGGGTVVADPVSYSKVHAHMELGSLQADGTKKLDGSTTTNGNPGQEYHIVLPTGEQINFRNSDSTGTARTQQGRVTFTLSPGDDSAASLARVEEHLNLMGLDLNGANEEDAQSVYWRQMFNRLILSNTSASPKAIQDARTKLVNMLPELRTKTGDQSVDERDIVEAIGLTMSPEEEHSFWKSLAENTFGADKVNVWLANGQHLPQYQHMDLAHPEANTGHAYFNRIDVSKEDLQKKNTLIAIGNKGKDNSLLNYITSGGMLATEERYRIFGYKTGASSSEDQSTGGATGVFTRIAKPGTASETTGALMGAHVAYWNPGVLQQTGTYSYDSDNFGNTSNLTSGNKFDPVKSLSSYGGTGNETLVQHQLSILDHLEIMVFESPAKRNEAIQRMKALGHDTLRGVPIEDRLIMRSNLTHAMQVVKAAWQQ